jgi:ferredoxin
VDTIDRMIVEHQVILKVCELCGRLFCQTACGYKYCIACEVELREFPPVGSRKLRGRQARVKFLSKPLAGVFDEER